MEWIFPLLLFACVCGLLIAGYPVALTLAGVSLLFAWLGAAAGLFDATLLATLPSRIFGVMSNATLLAVPLFVFMGVMLEKSRVAESLLSTLNQALGNRRGGLAVSLVLVGALLAASTGIVGATVVTLGALALPAMLARGYAPGFAGATVCATGTLGQIIPPSIALVLLGDAISTAYQEAQLSQGVFATKSVSVGSLFMGALGPGLLLVALYLGYVTLACRLHAQSAASAGEAQEAPAALTPSKLALTLAAPFALILAVLGSILTGVATPTEAAALGAAGATLLAWLREGVRVDTLREVAHSTLHITSMVFLILIGATVFSLVFRGGGDEVVQSLFSAMPGGRIGALLVVMALIFALGFVLDFIEITFVVVPIVAPILLAMGFDPVWLGVMIALNLQTSFLTPPFGFALFYLRGVAPAAIATGSLYRGVVPFVALQIVALVTLAIWPQLVTWLPAAIGKQ